MGRESQERRWRKLARKEHPVRLVPSRRGLATVFAATAFVGAGVGLAVFHFFGPVCR